MQTFRAMNTDVAVIARTADEAVVAAAVARVFADAEQRFSRFRADSELSRLNRATEPVTVSEPMFAALVAARRYVELTDGLFDPAIGSTLVALGYDRSFTPGGLDRDTDRALPPRGSFLAVTLDAERREVTRPAGIQIDLGGVIKGRTVDAATACLPRDGAIDAGGDAALRGGPSAGWPVAIEDPRDPSRTIGTLRVRNAAVATSAANRRRWKIGGADRHHLVDPRTQRSAVTDVVQATVVAPTAELADVLAKTVFLLGAARARDFLAGRDGVGAVIVPTDGAPIAIGAVDLVRS